MLRSGAYTDHMTRIAYGRLRIVGTYGVAHALVDASCAATVFNASASGRVSLSLAAVAVLIYNLLAFASQPLLGWFLRDAVTGRTWAKVGGAVTSAAFFVSLLPNGFWIAVILAGLGNAVFHLGGGVVALRLEPGRASLPGLFVAPGAAGLAIGMWMGTNQWAAWLPALALALTVPFLRLEPESGTVDHSTQHSAKGHWLALVVGILFFVVALRAVIGSGLAMPWKSQPSLLWALTLAVVIGKASGGILADRFGRVAIGVGALLVSAPLLIVGPSLAPLGIAGMLLFNMTMPVTLVALADALPERPGFAFGLTCLALIAGTLPLTMHLVGGLNPWAAGLLTACSAGLLWMGLKGWSDTRAGVLLDTRPQEV